MTDTEKIKWAIERNQSEFVRICEHCFGNDCNNCYEKNYHVLIDDALKGMMDNTHSIDTAPVISGHWKWAGMKFAYRCSICNHNPVCGILSNYCPNCGTKMDGVIE